MRLRDWLESTSNKSGSRIILALDLEGPYQQRLERASLLVSQLGGRVAGIKVNWHLLLPFGVLGLRRLTEQCAAAGLPVIADMKLNDIGSTNLEAVDILFSNGFDALIANPFVGYREGMDGVIRRSHELGKGVVLLVYMSHAGAREGYGLRAGREPMYVRFARNAGRWGSDGVVVSAKSLGLIRKVRSLVGREQIILSPGVGFQGGDAVKAVNAGTDYIIVGRGIVAAKDPSAALDALNKSMRV